MKRGEIYYIKSNYSETGFEQKGDRPAVIVSNDKCNAHSCVLEVCYMTTQPKKPLPTHVLIREDSARPSTVLCEQITSVDIGRFSDYMGALTPDEMLEVDKALLISLGLHEYEPRRDERGIPLAPFEDDPPAEEAQEDEEAATVTQEDYDELWDECRRLEIELATYKNIYADLIDRIKG